MTKKSITAIIQVTNDCNLRCPYCYANSEKFEKNYMNETTLKNVIEQLMKTFDEVRIQWHGGEPTLVCEKFFKKVKKLQSVFSNCRVINGIQTNGTLLTEKFLDFCKKEDFQISLSLDGNKHLHNLTRIYPNGSGSFDKVMKVISLMKNKEIKFGAICILNKNNIKEIDEIYDFFNENQIDVRINSVEPTGRAKINN